MFHSFELSEAVSQEDKLPGDLNLNSNTNPNPSLNLIF